MTIGGATNAIYEFAPGIYRFSPKKMIVGIAGKAASGKTTAANYMAEHLQAEVRIVPMAQLLRDEVELFLRAIGSEEYVPLVYGCQDDKIKVFYIDERQAADACGKWSHFVSEHADIQDRPGQTAITVRRILQWWGTEYRRTEDPDYWTKAWAEKVESFDLDNIHILVDDVRVMNELDTVRAEGGLIIKIERPGFNGAGNHVSETSLDAYTDWNRVIVNDGTLEDFRLQIELLTDELHNASG